MLKTKHPLYDLWKGMRQRCSNPNADNYHHYGGRGIKIDPSWLDFWVFVSDVGERPTGYMLDRIDNDGDYCKSNCRWASYHDQARNKRNTYRTPKGAAVDVSKELGGSAALVTERIRLLGWSVEKAISTPVNKKPRKYITIDGVTDTPTGWARKLRINQGTLWYLAKGKDYQSVISNLLKVNHAVQK